MELHTAGSRHLYYQWPLVPSGELILIRQLLLRPADQEGLRPLNRPPEAAREMLLDLVTAELKRRGQQGTGSAAVDGPSPPVLRPAPLDRWGRRALRRSL
jgi:hypothetical protein